ncbi:Protein hedgehog [Seminavis robusta]|uniref:Protein hedgehog n=1 Tax=Seminavis robusta TaxID=568900 RepID=A0A9N8H2X8_9STRA|nr:Protein hedgehog [Seminavis robusta]|eukprot:Sro46_g027430.1 Protein hedgehog (700) ;mRNA; r:66504-68603
MKLTGGSCSRLCLARHLLFLVVCVWSPVVVAASHPKSRSRTLTTSSLKDSLNLQVVQVDIGNGRTRPGHIRPESSVAGFSMTGHGSTDKSALIEAVNANHRPTAEVQPEQAETPIVVSAEFQIAVGPGGPEFPTGDEEFQLAVGLASLFDLAFRTTYPDTYQESLLLFYIGFNVDGGWYTYWDFGVAFTDNPETSELEERLLAVDYSVLVPLLNGIGGYFAFATDADLTFVDAVEGGPGSTTPPAPTLVPAPTAAPGPVQSRFEIFADILWVLGETFGVLPSQEEQLKLLVATERLYREAFEEEFELAPGMFPKYQISGYDYEEFGVVVIFEAQVDFLETPDEFDIMDVMEFIDYDEFISEVLVNIGPFFEEAFDYDLIAIATEIELTSAPTSAPGSTGDSSDDSDSSDSDVCFSGSTTVVVQDKGMVAMQDLQVGDLIFQGFHGRNKDPVFQPVYAFGHRDPSQWTTYLQLHAALPTSRQHAEPLEITKDHLVFKIDPDTSILRPTRAKDIQVGDTLRYHDMDTQRHQPVIVAKIGFVRKRGAYMPLTRDGSIVASGILASNYVSIQDIAPTVTERATVVLGSEHVLSHMWLAPLRIWCTNVAPTSRVCTNTQNDTGILPWLLWGKWFAESQDGNHFIVHVLIGSVLVALFLAFWAIETLLTSADGSSWIVTAYCLVCAWRYCRPSSSSHVKKELKQL